MGNCGDRSNINQPQKVNKVNPNPQEQQQTPQNNPEDQQQPQVQQSQPLVKAQPQQTSKEVLTLGYWGIRGRVQPIRFLLEYVGLQYVEQKYTSREEWETEKEKLLETNPLANLPYIKDEKEIIFETQALPIFIVNKSGTLELLPNDIKEAVACNQAQGIVSDLISAFITFLLKKPLNNQKLSQTALQEFSSQAIQALKPFYDKLEFLLDGKTFITGDKPKVADFFIYEQADLLKTLDPATLNHYTNLQRFHSAFRALPQIENYIESKRFQEKPFFTPQYSPI